MTMSLFRNWFGGLSDEDQKVLDALKDSGVTKARVVEHSAVVKDAEDVASSQKFQDYADKADKIVARQG